MRKPRSVNQVSSEETTKIENIVLEVEPYLWAFVVISKGLCVVLGGDAERLAAD